MSISKALMIAGAVLAGVATTWGLVGTQWAPNEGVYVIVLGLTLGPAFGAVLLGVILDADD